MYDTEAERLVVASDAGTRRGQTMVEYLIVAGALLGVLVLMSFLLYALKLNGNRILDLVASEYP